MIILEIEPGTDGVLGVDPYTNIVNDINHVNEAERNAKIVDDFLTPTTELNWELLNLLLAGDESVDNDKSEIVDRLVTNPTSLNRTKYRFKRTGIDGQISGYQEEVDLKETNFSASTSLSVNRDYTSKSQSLRGETGFLPFQPGGLIQQASQDREIKDSTLNLHRSEYGLFDIPPGFSRGVNLSSKSGLNGEKNDGDKSLVLFNMDSNEVDGSEVDDLSDGTLQTRTFAKPDVQVPESSESTAKVPFNADEVEGLVPFDFSTFGLEKKKVSDKRTWAHVVDLDHKLEDFHELVPNMARTWPFELDVFQKEAVFHLEQGDSVFVAAHTSAGKTVVAEYAIAMAKRNMTKCIYTSPIKALSNQKFRDFKETFKDVDVGLITGDVQINPDANCLIMTTEILRSMLYRGADLIRDVEFVIFDEVHYVNDIDRGVVWEEVIIMLPDHVKYILLSATVPNTFEFANWVGRTKQKDIYVISTPKRPVPLEIYVSAKNKLFKVVDANRRFLENEFKAHKDVLEAGKAKKELPSTSMGLGSRGGPGGTARGGNRGGSRGGSRGGGQRGGVLASNRGNFSGPRRQGNDGPNKNTWPDLVHYLKLNSLLPAVIFVFSKKKCEEYADSLRGIDFCNSREKSEIHMFIDRAVSRLKKEDRELPQIMKIRDMLSRGIAVHHGGLLPIVKECIEILFAKTLVKVLFATETFAMGLNLPTRTVVFSSTRKHDGRSFRNLLPGEFTQMSGRAGRRGLDKTGTVIIMAYNDPLSPTDFKEVALGAPTKLLSQFRLTYNMILNLLRIEALKVEEMIKHSFSENSSQVLLPENQRRYDYLLGQLKDTELQQCLKCQLQGVEETCQLLFEYENTYGQCVVDIHKSPILKTQLLKTGRLVCFRDKSDITRVGFVMKSDSATDSILLLTFNHGKEYEAAAEKFKLPYVPIPGYLQRVFPKIRYNEGLKAVTVPYEHVIFIGRYSLKTPMFEVLDNKQEAVKEAGNQIGIISRLQNHFEESAFKHTKQLTLHDLCVQKDSILTDINDLHAFTCPDFKQHYNEYRKRYLINKEIEGLQRLISDENLDLLPDYEQRLDVLMTLGFIDPQHNVVLKGRVACEINSGWELILTELVLDNFLGDFEPAEIVALLSCFVYEGRTREEEPPLITPRLEEGKSKILKIADQLLKVFIEKRVLLTSEEEDFVESKRFALVNVVYEWANGLSFNEIMQMSVEAEGTIVRVITRLDEICREVKNAALIIGDSKLHLKMAEAQEKIKRDIVFCASLYL
ncbi:antiviral helicase SKI2 [Lodderomyces elongisporus NRRL YB-4239]|uniref:Antiviral helicase SKI2 n=1 Tax=Lodderomyces elongisporus (strain ATCC 11503 / CBS 2605 / JCM 1781 / NBRC 1676 / NRRL YB-4239) TaxID=379508 RepID=A5E0H1_LODEL|nr:antiviral helicase SKI2 [Lodderomyces elongisporus NRRL YB-4239]